MTKNHANAKDNGVPILKMLLARHGDGPREISDMRGIELKPQVCDPEFFKFESRMEMLTERPRGDVHALLASFGPTDFLMTQSVLPVVAWSEDDNIVRCIGTASIVSCSGYLITAAHVLLDGVLRWHPRPVRLGGRYNRGPRRLTQR
jgi:hypothetical protein